MYLGVILHSTIAYKAGYHPRYWIKDPDYSSFVFDHIYFWIHSFRMPLFFLLSGFFAVVLSRKIGFKSFLKNRFERIAIPLLVCLVTILPLSIAPFTFSRLYLDAGSTITESINLTLNEIWSLITFQRFKGLQHFWFLLNLIYFYLFFIALEKLGFHFESKFNKIRFSGWQFVMLVTFFTYLVLLGYYKDLMPSIWTGLFPRNPQLIYYGMYFIFGVYIYYNINLLDFFRRNCILFLVVGSILSVVNVFLINEYLQDGDLNALVFAYKAMGATQNVMLGLGMIGLCLKLFNSKSPAVRYASDASYWVYIIHLFLVASFQILSIIFDVYPPIRFFATLLLTSLLAYLTYHLLVRYTIMGTYLHGRRTKEE